MSSPNRRICATVVTLTALLPAYPAGAQQTFPGAQLFAECDADGMIKNIDSKFCEPVTEEGPSFLRLNPNTRAILFPTPDCSGPSRGLSVSTAFCEQDFSDGNSLDNNVRSVFLWSGPSYSILDGLYRSSQGRELEIAVQEDGRIAGFLTADWETSNTRLRVPLGGGLARWANRGFGIPEEATLATEDFFLTLFACAGLSTLKFVDDTTCVSYTGAAEVPNRQAPIPTLVLQRGFVRGNRGGFDVGGAVEVFQRVR